MKSSHLGFSTFPNTPEESGFTMPLILLAFLSDFMAIGTLQGMCCTVGTVVLFLDAALSVWEGSPVHLTRHGIYLSAPSPQVATGTIARLHTRGFVVTCV